MCHLQWKIITPSQRECQNIIPPTLATFDGESWQLDGYDTKFESFDLLDATLASVIRYMKRAEAQEKIKQALK